MHCLFDLLASYATTAIVNYQMFDDLILIVARIVGGLITNDLEIVWQLPGFRNHLAQPFLRQFFKLFELDLDL